MTNVHVRYEDSYTDPTKPFSVGVTLRELSCQTTDENWMLKVIREAASIIFKVRVRDRPIRLCSLHYDDYAVQFVSQIHYGALYNYTILYIVQFISHIIYVYRYCIFTLK